jgi:hypothetical protein
MDLAKLNSATKYPSILTYHELGDRGRLKETVQVPFVEGQEIFVTEKIDGANGRIVVLPESSLIVHAGITRRYLIGSREEFLTAHGDLIYPPDYSTVDALRNVASVLPSHPDLIEAFYFEVFGGSLPASKEYSSTKQVSIRLFDHAGIPPEILDLPIEKIASWRDHGGQTFKTDYVTDLLKGLKEKGLSLATVPQLGKVTKLPTSVKETYEWLKEYSATKCDLGGGKGRAEGVVVRTWDRSKIAKLRFEDYERTLGVKRG